MRFALLLSLTVAGVAHAGLTNPFTEDFIGGDQNWRDSGGAFVDWFSNGGVDDGSYISSLIEVPQDPPPFGLNAFRAQDEFGSSGGAFEGNWVDAGITELSFWMRHDGPAPLNVFARLSGPANFPGAAGVSFVPILPDVWTEVVIDFSEGSPQVILEGTPYEDVFSDIGHVQIGFDPGDPFLGSEVRIDLDRVGIAPAPGALALLAIGGAGFGSRRRRG